MHWFRTLPLIVCGLVGMSLARGIAADQHAGDARAVVDEHDADEHGHGDAEHDHGADADEHGHGDAEHDHGAEAEREHGEAEHDHGADAHGDGELTVALTAAEIVEFGLQIAAAGPGIIAREISLPGEVRPNEDRLAHIVPRYAGIVTDVRVGIGDEVARGDVLAVLESDESLAPFEVTTLISGTVIGKHITLGEAAARDRDAFVIADLSTVWVDLTVYQRDLGRVAVGQSVHVRLGQEGPTAAGRVAYVTPVVDERTRTATARIVLSNQEEAWRPGMFVTGDVLVERREVPIAIEESAVHRFEDEPTVFVETPAGFVPRHLELGDSGGGRIEVRSGLSVGERYVAVGGFTLKAELEKGSFGHAGHAH